MESSSDFPHKNPFIFSACSLNTCPRVNFGNMFSMAGASLFLRLKFYVWMLFIVSAYIASAEIAKRYFYRKWD